ncbi:MAG: tubulin-like doman-containing protein, partial [Armatimonadetes bacterium]|nr:tubulin-like doman-containing protein [Armatimonadota bacterium]
MPKVEREVQQVNLQRSLVIGLGGCGAEVIKRLRRLLTARFGRFEDIPIVSFLYIDTDPNWLRQMASEIEDDIRLPDSERLDAQFPDAAGLYRNIREGHNPNYSWFSLEKLQHHTSVIDGAGTIRQLGRLCFWHHAADIHQKMESLLSGLNDDRNAQFMQDQYGVAVDPGLNIHIIAGLAGGTGSGMFLDMAYTARRVLQSLGLAGAHQLLGYLILPGAFRDLAGANAIPNGYAALKEMNYYQYMYDPDNPLAPIFGRSVWGADYTRIERHRAHFEGQPPFNFCYLLDSRNSQVQLRREDIYAMIARSLFHEFTLSFATFKRSLRANIRNRIVSNDGRDCPRGFMSFGQSAVFLPHDEIEQVLGHQLALRAVQQWIDKATEPIDVLAANQETANVEEAAATVINSVKQQAGEPQTVGAVRNFLVRQFMPGAKLNPNDILSAIVSEEHERLVDVPTTLKEAEKQRWIVEKWPIDAFIGRVTEAWRRWRADFSDEGPDPMAWGEQMRKLIANKDRAQMNYRRSLHARIFEMFEDTEHYGPAWTLAVAQLLPSAFDQMKDQLFLSEANDPVSIAKALGDVHVISVAQSGRGPSLSTIIEPRISVELDGLDRAVKSLFPVGKRDRVEAHAYQYLTWCAHWCRARVEERSRRLAAELLDSLRSTLEDTERELLEYAGILARLQADLLTRACEWNRKAALTENIGSLLYDPNLLQVLEKNVKARQGDRYDPSAVARQALNRLGKTLRDLRQDDVPALMSALIEAARDAIGELDENMLQETRFAAYDLLSARCSGDNNALDQTLRRATASGAPFVMLDPSPPGGNWVKDEDLLEIREAGLHGGYHPQDTDPERARVAESLARTGWNVANEVQDIDDSSQIVFFQECGGFPLRALQGIEEMKKAYEEYRKGNGPPLHIVRDEMA